MGTSARGGKRTGIGESSNARASIAIKPLAKHVGIDMGEPQAWYRDTRRLRRKIHLHVGPTNSGKTYQALQALMREPARGIYCGPLRLLAWEVCEKIRDSGLACSLVTGQEIDIQGDEDGSAHKACTIEMTDLRSRFKIGIIDEGQLFGDKSRGWAWTQAFLGLQAEEIHVCGSENLVDIVEKMAALCGDEIVAKNMYERLSPLSVGAKSVESWGNILPGDCIVGFQRRRLYEIKSMVEKQNPTLRCCVVYGGLPPETRRAQANLFSDPNSGFQVLVASDAIGMGLNLTIKRVVFSAMSKFDGRTRRELTSSEIRQIAGRAGRYNVGAGSEECGDSGGIATCMRADDLSVIRRGLQTSLPRVKRAGLFPSLEQLELLGVFVDYNVDKEVLADFWLDKMQRDWGTEGGPEGEGDEALRQVIMQRIADCSSAGAVVQYFGSISAFSHSLELFIYDSLGQGEEGEEGGDEERDDTLRAAKSAQESKHRRVKRIDRLRRKSRDRGSDDAAANVRAPMGASLSQLLEIFREMSAVDSGGVFFLCDLDERLAIASLLDDITALSFRERYIMSMAPVSRDDEEVKIYFRRFAQDKALAPYVALLDDLAPRPDGSDAWLLPSSPGELLQMETKHKIFELYLWLAQRFPASFPQHKEAKFQADVCSRLISQALVTLGHMEIERKMRAQAGRRKAAEEASRKKKEAMEAASVYGSRKLRRSRAR